MGGVVCKKPHIHAPRNTHSDAYVCGIFAPMYLRTCILISRSSSELLHVSSSSFPAPEQQDRQTMFVWGEMDDERQRKKWVRKESGKGKKTEGKDHVANVTQSVVYQRKSLAHSPPLHLSNPLLLHLLFPQLSSYLLSSNLLLSSSTFPCIFFPPKLISTTVPSFQGWPDFGRVEFTALSPPASQCPHCQSQWKMEAVAHHWHDKFLLSSDPVNQTPTVVPLKTSLTFQWLSWWLVKTVILLASKLFN